MKVNYLKNCYLCGKEFKLGDGGYYYIDKGEKWTICVECAPNKRGFMEWGIVDKIKLPY